MARRRNVKLKLEHFLCALNQYFSAHIFLQKYLFVFVQLKVLQQAADLNEYIDFIDRKWSQKHMYSLIAYLLN